MEVTEESRSSIYIAPLHIVKSASDLTNDALDSSPESPSVEPETSPQPQWEASIQPVTLGAEDVSPKEDVATERPAFHNYLRAFYPFQASNALSPTTVTLDLNAGDLLLVHSIHTNGWADGTLLSGENGARGWLPTNYCEAYEELPMRPLLKALTEFWDVIRNGSGTSLDIFRNQDYMRGLIAGVRFLLEKSACLTRDSPVVKTHEGIRKTRKALLSDLSMLVKIAKRLQDITLGNATGESVDDMFDEMLLKAFKIVTRGVKFLDIWNEEIGLNRTVDHTTDILEATIKYQQAVSPVSEKFDEDIRTSNVASAGHIVSQHRVVPQDIQQKNANPVLVEESQRLANSRQSWIQTSSSQKRSSLRSRPASIQSRRMSVSHRMSYTGQAAELSSLRLASAKLDFCYDGFLGVLGSFLGLHMQSRSSSELLLTTQQSVKSCRDLLAVIEVVLDHDLRRSDMLLEAKDAMYDKITELVHAAREVFSPVNAADEESIYLPEQGKSLVNAATACVRGAGECVAKTRLVLEEIGDFELESAEVCSPTLTPNSLQSSERASEESGRPHTFISAPIRHAPLLHVQEQTLAHPRPLSDMLTLGSITDTATLLTPDSAASFMVSPISPTFGGPVLTPPTPATVSDDESSSPLSETRPSDEHLRREKSLSRNVVMSTGSSSTYMSSIRDSRISAVSETSTRATSPDQHTHHLEAEQPTDSFSGRHTAGFDEFEEAEQKLLQKTFAHELMYNKEGQVMGGSLPALIEKLTAHDSAPDALFVSTFYLTFRLFTTPLEFAETLASRFDYVGETPKVAGPVRLRVYNIFKGWLESHWRHDCDDVALPYILQFARKVLALSLPAAGKRLAELAEIVQSVHGHVVPRLISSIGKTNTSIAQYFNPDSPLPAPIISKSQLAALRNWKNSGPSVSILEFDPLELARQITLKESSIFCSILPEELVATEWNKRSGSLAVNVRAMSTLSTDLANLVADSILQLEEPKKRAILIKHWVKIASKCLELNNYDTLMAIICSLNSSTISRLKKTWEVVSQKTKSTLEDLRNIVDVSRNYAVLRNRLQNHVPPCLPFVGTYLTDLTFVDHGNQASRKLDGGAGSIDVINFDKHVKTARVISELQRFQIPYRLTEVPELQTWMQDQLVRVRSSGEKSFQNYYRRSLVLEPREQGQQRIVTTPTFQSSKGDKERFDFLSWAHLNKEKPIETPG